jgi:hypothetical protein
MVDVVHITAWVVANTTHILGTLLLILIPTCYLYWRNSIKRAIRKKLQVHITRNPASAKRVDWYKHSPLLGYLDVDKSVAAADYPELNFSSLGDYMASLDANGKISIQKALISIIERSGLRIALPLALFAPEPWTRESDVVGAFNKSPYAALLVSNMLSTLGLISVSTVAQRQNIDAKKYTERAKGQAATETVVEAARTVVDTNNEQKTKLKALQLMVIGSNPTAYGGLSSRLVNPFHLVNDFPAATGSTIHELLVTSDQTPLPAPEPVLINDIFPDLANGNGGCMMAVSEGQAKVSQVFAIICNKLAANSLVGLNVSKMEPKEAFTVLVPGQTTPIDSVEDLIEALEKCSHTTTVRIFANTTSFGAGLCIKEKDSNETDYKYTQIPLAYPLSTGLYAQDENGEDVDVITLMQHAAVQLHVSGPLITAQVDWCLSVNGMTGWGPVQEINRVWTRSDNTRTWHAEKELSTPAGRRSALRLTTTSAATLNCAASEEQLLMGGYGALGVCIDSVAAIQQCLTGSCTLYPLILGGDAKMGLLSCYKNIMEQGKKVKNTATTTETTPKTSLITKSLSFTRSSSSNTATTTTAAAAANGWKYEAEAKMLVSALLELPCDGIVAPTEAAKVAQRALSCLPKRSVFAGIQQCRKSLQAAIRTANGVMAMQKSSE